MTCKHGNKLDGKCTDCADEYEMIMALAKGGKLNIEVTPEIVAYIDNLPPTSDEHRSPLVREALKALKRFDAEVKEAKR